MIIFQAHLRRSLSCEPLWDDDVTDPERTLTLTEDISLVATFKVSEPLVEPENPDVV